MNANPRITTVYDVDARKLHQESKRAEARHRAYAKTAKKSVAANDSLSRSFKGAAQGVTAIDGPLGGIAGRLTAVNGLLGSGAGLWAGLGAGVAGATFLLSGAVSEFAKVEQQQLKIEAVLRATGGAAGQTAEQLDAMARQLARETLAAPEGIRNAITTLLTFKSVSGDAFGRTIILSQDLAATMGGDARNAALQLGKALEDPATGLTALRRSGVSFTDVERDLIISLHETGDAAKAQGLILDKLAEQVGGAGAAEGAGLAGKVDLLAQSWGELKEALNETSGAGDFAGEFLDGLSRRIDNLSKVINPSDRLQVQGLHRDYVELGEQIAKIESKGFKRFGSTANKVNGLKAERALIKQQIKEFQDIEKSRIIEAQKRQEEAKKLEAAAQEKIKAEKLAAKAKRDAIESRRRLSIKQKQDSRIISLQKKKFERLHEQSLQAQGKESALEISRFDRQVKSLDEQYQLMRKRGLLTLELEEQFRLARENAEVAHLGRMRDLFESEDDDVKKDDEVEEAKTLTQALAEEFRIRLNLRRAHTDGTIEEERRKSEETSSFFAQGLEASAATSKKWYKFQKAINIYQTLQDTYAAAVAAYKSLSGIPVVGPALGAGAALVATKFGKEKVEAIRSGSVPSFMGGGFTGSGPRVGGVDGKGGINAIVHPDEYIFDTKAGGNPLAPTIIINEAPNGGAVDYDQQKNQVIIDFAVKKAVSDVVGQIARGGPVDSALSSAYGLNRSVRR